MKKVFLGGTCCGSKWRNQLIRKLEIDYFDPVVPNWNEEAYQRELKERENCDFLLYVITPKISGVYSIAEAVDDSNKRPEKTLFCILDNYEGQKFSKSKKMSLNAVFKMVKKNGGNCFRNLDEVVEYLNNN